jgi:hypothetical protein
MKEGANTENSYWEKITFSFFDLVKKHIKLLMAVVVLSAGLAVLYSFLKAPTYKSRLTFSLDSGGQSSDLSAAAGLASQLGFSIGGGSSMFAEDNIIEIMMSRRVIENVLLSEHSFNNKEYKLIEYYLNESGAREDAPSASPFKTVHFPVGSSREQYSYVQDSVLKEVYLEFNEDMINVKRPDKKLNIYEVSVETWNEIYSKVFTDRLISETDSFYKDVCTQKSLNTVDILEKRALEIKNNLHQSIDAKSQRMDADLNPAFALTVAPVEKEEYNVQLYGEAYAELFKNLEIARFQYLKDIPLLQIIDQAGFPMEKVRIRKSVALLIGAACGFFLFSLVLMMIVVRRIFFLKTRAEASKV